MIVQSDEQQFTCQLFCLFIRLYFHTIYMHRTWAHHILLPCQWNAPCWAQIQPEFTSHLLCSAVCLLPTYSFRFLLCVSLLSFCRQVANQKWNSKKVWKRKAYENRVTSVQFYSRTRTAWSYCILIKNNHMAWHFTQSTHN